LFFIFVSVLFLCFHKLREEECKQFFALLIASGVVF
jgi:hypothetical protein